MQLSSSVSLRAESFGAMAYDFHSRRLSFLKSRPLVAVVEALGSSGSVEDALTGAGVPVEEWGRYRRALRALERQGTLVGSPGLVTGLEEPSSSAGGVRPSSTAGSLQPSPTGTKLVDQFEYGLDAPICLTWELTYACNLSCVHCLSSSGRRDPDELSTAEAKALIDEFQRMKIFYVNIGGGEPTVRPDFWELLDYAVAHQVGVKFSTNGFRITPERARMLAATDYVDVQISLDGATAEVNDAVRGEGTYDAALRALANLQAAGMRDMKISVVCTRHNIGQLDEFKAIADSFGAQLRLTRLRPSGRGADVWADLHPLPEQQRELYDWLVANGERVLTGDSFFHLSAYASDEGAESLPGLNLCGAGRVVCLVDPVGDVYACPFAIHDRFKAGNVREQRGFDGVWRHSELFADLRSPQTGGACTRCSAYDACRGGCMAAKFFTGLPLDGPDPECVKGNADLALAGARPAMGQDHSHRGPVRNAPVPLTLMRRAPDRACEEDPLAGLVR